MVKLPKKFRGIISFVWVIQREKFRHFIQFISSKTVGNNFLPPKLTCILQSIPVTLQERFIKGLDICSHDKTMIITNPYRFLRQQNAIAQSNMFQQSAVNNNLSIIRLFRYIPFDFRFHFYFHTKKANEIIKIIIILIYNI